MFYLVCLCPSFAERKRCSHTAQYSRVEWFNIFLQFSKMGTVMSFRYVFRSSILKKSLSSVIPKKFIFSFFSKNNRQKENSKKKMVDPKMLAPKKVGGLLITYKLTTYKLITDKLITWPIFDKLITDKLTTDKLITCLFQKLTQPFLYLGLMNYRKLASWCCYLYHGRGLGS